jgi:hypothetical protein
MKADYVPLSIKYISLHRNKMIVPGVSKNITDNNVNTQHVHVENYNENTPPPTVCVTTLVHVQRELKVLRFNLTLKFLML